MDEVVLNDRRSDSVEIRCSCRGKNPVCQRCDGTGAFRRPACKMCGGTGYEGRAKCIDCRGQGWREVEFI
jgi:hypothetical protein